MSNWWDTDNAAVAAAMQAAQASNYWNQYNAQQNVYGQHTHNVTDPGHSHSIDASYNYAAPWMVKPTEEQLDKHPALKEAWDEAC